jgi:DNA-binding NarL/FixJ family response regulator
VNDQRIPVIESKQLMFATPLYRLDSLSLDAARPGWREFALQRRVNRSGRRNRLSQCGARQLSRRFLNLGELRHSLRFSRGILKLSQKSKSAGRGRAGGARSVKLPYMTNPIRVLLLTDNESDTDLITSELARSGMSTVTTRVDSRDSFVHALRTFSPDVVLSEFSSNRFDARGALDVMRSATPAIPLIVFTDSISGAGAVSCLRAGVEDLVLRRYVARLAASISDAISRRRPLGKLTMRQIEVLRLVAEGHRTRDIAEKLKLSVKTVESHRGEVMKRLEIHDVVSLVRYAVRVGLVPTS